jgi:ABC-2 type transport system ATP-binding protein
MPSLITSQGLSKRYGSTVALEGVQFDVREGITGLLGANGAGKSTSIKLFLGLVRPTSGSISVLGEVPHESVAVRARLGYMPEHDCLPDSVTASEFLSHMAEVSGLPPVDAKTRAADILRHVGLDEERYRTIGEYSTGMKQRVKLAQALVHDPVLVFLDEPTAGLDPVGREDMLELIRRTGRVFGISIVLSSHLLGDVQSTCDRVIVLDGGQITRMDELESLTTSYNTLVIEVDEGRAELINALRNRGLSVTEQRNILVVEQRDEADFDLIRDAVVEVDAPLRRLAPLRHSLGEVFAEAES